MKQTFWFWFNCGQWPLCFQRISFYSKLIYQKNKSISNDKQNSLKRKRKKKKTHSYNESVASWPTQDVDTHSNVQWQTHFIILLYFWLFLFSLTTDSVPTESPYPVSSIQYSNETTDSSCLRSHPLKRMIWVRKPINSQTCARIRHSNDF